ncbi:MAG: hypothetical protein P3W93_009790 [Thermus sp.]|nr:hypothetical protein [Thermus sp.]
MRTLPSLLLFPWDIQPPREVQGSPLHLFTHVWDKEELMALRDFSEHILRAYARLVHAYPWAKGFLPPYLPDGRTNPFRRGPPSHLPPGEMPGEDSFLQMAAYWDGLAWELSEGRMDLLPLTPSPLKAREGWLLYTPTWVLLTKKG